MAHSQFLQQKSCLYGIHLSDESGKVSICLLVLKDLVDWIGDVEHEEVIASIDLLKKDLFAVIQELETINNPGTLLNYCQEAYDCAFGAEQKYDDGEYRAASAHINDCRRLLRKAIK